MKALRFLHFILIADEMYTMLSVKDIPSLLLLTVEIDGMYSIYFRLGIMVSILYILYLLYVAVFVMCHYYCSNCMQRN